MKWGEKHRSAKLTPAAVRAIRSSKDGCVKLGRRYGIAKQNAWRVKARRTWKEVSP